MYHIRSTIILIILSLLLSAVAYSDPLVRAAPAPVHPGGAAGAPLQGAFLPIVATGAPTSDVATVLECSCGYANATLAPNGTIYVMVQDYARGGRLYVYIDDGGPQLHEALAPPLAGAPLDPDQQPAFSFPAQKNGPGAMVVAGDMLIIYAPARPLGVLEGKYNLMRYRTPLASIVPQGP